MPAPFQPRVNMEREEIMKKYAFGLNDGIISIFAILAGLVGTLQNQQIYSIILIIVAITGAISLAIGEYITTKTQKEDFRQEVKLAQQELKLVPHISKEEIRHIYEGRGFKGDFLEEIVAYITGSDELWSQELAADEAQLSALEGVSEFKDGFRVFLAFVIGATFTVVPWVVFSPFISNVWITFLISVMVSMVGMFLIGALKTFVTEEHWAKTGMKMVFYGIIVGALSFLVGYLLGLVVGI